MQDKKLNYEAEHRKEILEGLKHMKRRLPGISFQLINTFIYLADSGTSLIKKLENLAVNLDCDYQNNGDTFLMKSAHSSNDLTLTILHKNDQVKCILFTVNLQSSFSGYRCSNLLLW